MPGQTPHFHGGLTTDAIIGEIILISASAGFGYAVAKYSELPGVLKRSVRKVKERLDAAKGAGLPEELEPIFGAAYAEVMAWENALEDDRITWQELREIGLSAMRLGKAVLAKLGR